MPESLDAALRDLAAEVAFPPTPDLRGAVAARLHERSRRSWAPVAWPRALVLGIAATVLITGVVVAAVLVIPGLRLTFTPSLPTASVPSNALATRLALGDPVALDAVDARVPAILGQPDEVYSARSGEVITLVYASSDELPELAGTGIGLLVQQINGSLERERIEKLIVEVSASVTELEIDGSPGYWIEGPPHLIRYRGPSGQERSEMTRLVGDTLVWQRGDVLYRIESGLGLETTLRIAESIVD
jgi:hypothetical protein